MTIQTPGLMHLAATFVVVSVAAYIESAFANVWLGALIIAIFVLGTLIGSVTEKYFTDEDPL